ncbi:hypothetical protein F8M41_020155 [Gigaspora margarita]|uniref:Uncharacterized protein n=1 Tax=Gigaspora margarita TaxID=4874 RepID=A0A8H4AIX2_GIGMA|nr:hypothetical protein F8M41_020155 [Gigaspora margarita]
MPLRSKTLPSYTKVERPNKFLHQFVEEPKEDASMLQNSINTTSCMNFGANPIVSAETTISINATNLCNSNNIADPHLDASALSTSPVGTNCASIWIYYYDSFDGKYYGIDYNGQRVDIPFKSYMSQVS